MSEIHTDACIDFIPDVLCLVTVVCGADFCCICYQVIACRCFKGMHAGQYVQCCIAYELEILTGLLYQMHGMMHSFFVASLNCSLVTLSENLTLSSPFLLLQGKAASADWWSWSIRQKENDDGGTGGARVGCEGTGDWEVGNIGAAASSRTYSSLGHKHDACHSADSH